MANNATLAEPVGTTAAPGSFKRRARRLGTVTGAVFGLIALGIAFAFFLETERFNNDATGGDLQVVGDIALSASNLFPTEAEDGGTNAVEDEFSLSNPNNATVEYVMAAACTNCGDPGSNQQKQWENLYISIFNSDGEEIYRGKLADMNEDYTGSPLTFPGSTQAGGPLELGQLEKDGVAAFTTKIWLADSGAEQPQNVLNTFAFDITAQTV